MGIDRPEIGDRPFDDAEPAAFELELSDHLRIEQAHRVGRDRIAKARMEFLRHRRPAEARVLLDHHHAAIADDELLAVGLGIMPDRASGRDLDVLVDHQDRLAGSLEPSQAGPDFGADQRRYSPY